MRWGAVWEQEGKKKLQATIVITVSKGKCSLCDCVIMRT